MARRKRKSGCIKQLIVPCLLILLGYFISLIWNPNDISLEVFKEEIIHLPGGVNVVPQEVIYFQGDGAYTDIITSKGKKKVAINLKTTLTYFQTYSFCRSHESFAVNRKFIKEKISYYRANKECPYIGNNGRTYKAGRLGSYKLNFKNMNGIDICIPITQTNCD